MCVFLIIMMVVLSGCATGPLSERMGGTKCVLVEHGYCAECNHLDRNYIDREDATLANAIAAVAFRACKLEEIHSAHRH